MNWDEDVTAYRNFIASVSGEENFQIKPGLIETNPVFLDRSNKHYADVSVHETLLICNGQDENGAPLFFGEFWLMPEIQILEYIDFSQEFHGLEHIDARARFVKNHIWNNSWFSLAIDGFGDQICIDFDPGPTGSLGQIIKVAHDSELREQLAPSLREFLKLVA